MKRLLLISFVLALAVPFVTAAPPTVGELLRSVPVTAQVVVAVDSAALRNHPKVQEWLLRQHAWTGADDDLRQFLTDAGLDPFRDVDAMVLAAQGEGVEAGAVALFSGRYDQTSLGAALVKRGAQPFSLASVSAYRLPSSGHHRGKSVVLAQISPDLVIVGEESAVGAAVASPHAVPPLVEKEISAGHVDLRTPFWIVATVPAAARQKAMDAAGNTHPEGGEAVRSVVVASGAVQRVVMQASLDDSLRLSGVAIADTPENAELLRDAVKGVIAAARLHAQSESPELVNVLRDAEVRVVGTSVSVSGAVPLPLLEKLAAEHKHPCQTSEKAQI